MAEESTSGQLKNTRKTLFDLQDKLALGPLGFLKEAITQQRKVKVVIRGPNNVRSILIGKVVVFDKHFNLRIFGVETTVEGNEDTQEESADFVKMADESDPSTAAELSSHSLAIPASNVGKPLDEQDLEMLLEKLGVADKEADEETQSNSMVPRFHQSVPDDFDTARLKLREEARAQLLQSKSRDILATSDLQKLIDLLENAKSPPFDDASELLLNYNDFCTIREKAPEKVRKYFSAATFAKLCGLNNDPFGRISTVQFLNYVTRKNWMQQTRIGLSLYDATGQGYLRETELESYIMELIPTLSQLDSLEKSFYSFYVCTAVRKFFFFLDPLRSGRVRIADILVSGFLDDLLELRDDTISREQLKQNWFSASNSLAVYGQYLNMDKDHDGMLSKEELARYGTGTLTGNFLDRLFQECLTFEGGKMDYKTYLDFVLAMENKRTPQALQYFFRILDLDQKGFLTVFDLNFFFKSIQQQLRFHNQDPIPFANIQDEIFDMVKPADPLKITLNDLLRSGQGATVVNLLTELHGFWNYENREYLLAENQSESKDFSPAGGYPEPSISVL